MQLIGDEVNDKNFENFPKLILCHENPGIELQIGQLNIEEEKWIVNRDKSAQMQM